MEGYSAGSRFGGILVALAKKNDITLERREAAERRLNEDQRRAHAPVADDLRQRPRRKTPRRRQIDPTTCERDYSDQEIEFMQAMDAYKRSSGRMFPTCSEILEVLRDLGYQQLRTPELTETEVDSDVAHAAPEELAAELVEET